jgi:hypothetical protein
VFLFFFASWYTQPILLQIHTVLMKAVPISHKPTQAHFSFTQACSNPFQFLTNLFQPLPILHKPAQAIFSFTQTCSSPFQFHTGLLQPVPSSHRLLKPLPILHRTSQARSNFTQTCSSLSRYYQGLPTAHLRSFYMSRHALAYSVYVHTFILKLLHLTFFHNIFVLNVV